MIDVNAVGQGLVKGVTPELCWEVVSDLGNWHTWASFIHDSHVVQPGISQTNGLGALRRLLDANGDGYLEIINIFTPPRLFGYHICEDAPLTEHQGVICLTGTHEGTEILWSMSARNNGFAAPDQGQAIMQQVMNVTFGDLVKACEAKSSG